MGERVEIEKSKTAKPESKSAAAKAGVDQRPKQGGIAAPPSFDLGEFAVGKDERKQLFVANLEGNDAVVAIRYSGSPAIAVESVPQVLRPSREGFDPSAAINLVVNPTAKGHLAGVLSISSQWLGAARAPEETQVHLTAAVHEVGHADLAQEEAEEARIAANAADAEASRKRLDTATAVANKRDATGELPGLPGFVRLFDKGIARYGSALQSLQDVRNAGVATARTEASGFERRPPAQDESVLETLAMLALEVVGVGLAGAIGAALEAELMESTVVAAHHNWVHDVAVAESHSEPSKAIVSAVTDSVKDLATRGAKAANPTKPSSSTAGTESEGGSTPADGASTDPMARFFEHESVALVGAKDDQKKRFEREARGFLEPMLRAQPQRAIATVTAMANSVEAKANEETAHRQAVESVLHWVRYVAQNSIGTKNAETTAPRNEPTSEIAGANHVSSSDGPDGLVDIAFAADAIDATKPVTVQAVRVNGVSKAIQKRIADNLKTARIPIRATAQFHPGGVEVVRDEIGNVDVSDESGAAGMPGNWFERRGGRPNGGRDVALRAGKQLIDVAIDEAAVFLGAGNAVQGDSKS